MAYAEKTKVSVMQSRVQVQTMIEKLGADEVTISTSQATGLCRIGFMLEGRSILFRMQIENQDTENKKQQESRRMWRALLLCLKAKFESVASGIESFDEAFLAYVVDKKGRRFGDVVIPQLPAILSGDVKGLLPAPDSMVG